LPDKLHKPGRTVGIDVGVNKLVATSDGEFYGTEFKAIRDKINRRKPGSKGRQRAYRERTNYMNRVVNQLPWDHYSVLGVEALSDLKRGKQRSRGKTFRKALSPWTYRHLLGRIEDKAEENRVLLVTVDPAYSSRTCPDCRAVNKASRRGEEFLCVACGWQGDADFVGSTEILVRTLRSVGSVESPTLQTH
jgi:IS605 OrfB family transposase